MTDSDAAEVNEQGQVVVARAKTLPRKLPLVVEPPALVPARMINEALYCERLMYLEWAQGEFTDNEFTVDGRMVHARADSPGGALPPVPSPSKKMGLAMIGGTMTTTTLNAPATNLLPIARAPSGSRRRRSASQRRSTSWKASPTER